MSRPKVREKPESGKMKAFEGRKLNLHFRK